MVQAGQYVTDGTAVFLVCDIRDGAQVGDIKMSPILRNGYVQANGALLPNASTNYPRLITFLADNPSLKAVNDTAWASNKALYVYDDVNDTLRVPDATGRVLQGGATAQSVEAGLPNISGYIKTEGRESLVGQNETTSTGPFNLIYKDTRSKLGSTSTTSTAVNIGFDFSASRSNSIYSNSTTVQPSALTMIPQIKY